MLDACIPLIPGGIFPIAAFAAECAVQTGHSANALDVLGLLVAELLLDTQPQRRTVRDRRRLN
jgi:hypothetical protein